MKAPIGLAIHTSSPDLGLALGSSDIIRHEVWDLGRDMTTYLHEKLAEFIAPQSFQELNLAFIAVAKGPGSFTGTRMGMTVARTLSQQLSIPLFGISSLGAIAAHHRKQQTFGSLPTSIVVQMEAQRKELHVGIYEDSSEWDTQSDRVLSSEIWQGKWNHIQADRSVHSVVSVDAPVHQGEFATAILDIAHRAYDRGDRPQWWAATPTYGQHPVIP